MLSPIKSIRQFCLKCAGRPKEVRVCSSRDCELYPYRMGSNPNRKGIGGGGTYPKNLNTYTKKLIKNIRSLPQYYDWRYKCLKRDNYTCQICNKNSSTMNVHHKIDISYIIELYNITSVGEAISCRLLWDINWGVSLCPLCHTKIGMGSRY